MRIPKHSLDLLANKIDDLYLVIKKIDTMKTISGPIEWISKNSIAVLVESRDNFPSKNYKEFFCYGRKGKFNDGSLPIFDLYGLVEDGTVRPLTKDEKYEILEAYSKKAYKNIEKIRKKIKDIRI